MSSSLLLCAVAFTSYASALAFPGPQATPPAAVGHLVFPPEPTNGPKAHPDLFRRQDVMTDLIAPDNTCGYISGLAGAAYHCNGETDLCAFFPGTSSTVGFIGCCNPDNFDCGARVTCIDYVEYYSSSLCDNGCVKDTFTLKCTALSAPFCNGIIFPKENVEDYFCDENYVSTWQTASTTYSFESDGRQFSPLVVTLTDGVQTSGSTDFALTVIPSTASPSPAQSTSSSDSQGPSSSAGGNGGSPPASSSVAIAASTSSTTAAPVAASSSGTPIGAIVGGAVGGAAGLSLIALVVFFILRNNKKKSAVVANANNGAAPPNYVPPQDPNNPAYAAAGAGKPAPVAQETALAGAWTPDNQYQQQQQYPPQMQQQQPPQTQGPYPPQNQQYSPPMQQQPYPPMAEVAGSYGQPQQQQNLNTGYYAQNPSPGQSHYSVSSPGQISPNSQAHLSAAFPDRNDTTSPVSTQRTSEYGMPGGSAQMPQSPAPTFMSNMGAPVTGAAAAVPTQLPSTEGRVEMSANMAGGSFPMDLHQGTYEVQGSEPHQQ